MKIIEKMLFVMKADGLVNYDERIFYIGVDIILLTAMDVLIVGSLGIVLNRFFESIIYLTGLIYLRTYSGGYHAKTRIGCLSLLVFIFLVYVYVLIDGVTMLSFIASNIILWNICPIEHANNRINLEDKGLYKKILHNRLLVVIVFSFVACAIDVKYLDMIIAVEFIVCVLAIIQFVINLKS